MLYTWLVAVTITVPILWKGRHFLKHGYRWKLLYVLNSAATIVFSMSLIGLYEEYLKLDVLNTAKTAQDDYHVKAATLTLSLVLFSSIQLFKSSRSFYEVLEYRGAACFYEASKVFLKTIIRTSYPLYLIAAFRIILKCELCRLTSPTPSPEDHQKHLWWERVFGISGDRTFFSWVDSLVAELETYTNLSIAMYLVMFIVNFFIFLVLRFIGLANYDTDKLGPLVAESVYLFFLSSKLIMLSGIVLQIILMLSLSTPGPTVLWPLLFLIGVLELAWWGFKTERANYVLYLKGKLGIKK